MHQIHLLLATPGEGRVLRARVTATPERSQMAADLGEALLFGVQFEPEAEAAPAITEDDDTRPVWARRACALEAGGRLDEAEQRRAGDLAGALQARRRGLGCAK